MRSNDVLQIYQPTAFSGQVVLITGAAQGMGLEISHLFAKLGAYVIMSDVQEALVMQEARTLHDSGYSVEAFVLDVADAQAIQRVLAQVILQYGQVDVLIHNAAFFPLCPLETLELSTLNQTLAVNLVAAFLLTQAVIPSMKLNGQGRIIIMSSVTGPRVAYPGLSHYAASKAGVNGFIKAAALELATHGITVNGIEPGMIETGAMANLGDDTVTASIAEKIPLGRLGTVQEIAGAIAFLASPCASYITGQTLIVDGGALLAE